VQNIAVQGYEKLASRAELIQGRPVALVTVANVGSTSDVSPVDGGIAKYSKEIARLKSIFASNAEKLRVLELQIVAAVATRNEKLDLVCAAQRDYEAKHDAYAKEKESITQTLVRKR
jgi:hypothetical protein